MSNLQRKITLEVPNTVFQQALVEIGETTTGEPGTDAAVENVGTETHAVLNFTIPRGEHGEQGEPGEGVPAGGTAGQILMKSSNEDYAAEWADIPDAAFAVEEVSDLSQANFAAADIKIGASPSGGAQIPVTSGWRASLAGTPISYAANSAADPLTITLNLLNASIPVGGTRRRYTSEILWRNGGKCFAFDLGSRITAFTPGSAASAQGANVRETGALKYLVGAQTGGYLLGGISTAGNGWLVTWGEGAVDLTPFAISVSNIRYYKIKEVTA